MLRESRLDLNDRDLIQGLRAQDPQAVRQLTDRYLPSIWRFIYFRLGGDIHLAEDIVSESVLALVKAVASDTQIDNLSGWLRSVAGHKVNDHYRAAARVQHLVEQVAQTADLVEPEQAATGQELIERRAEIRCVMDQLPEQHRLALEWKYVEKLSVREIAGRLEITEKAAESILFRARRTFRDKLLRADADEEPKPGGAARPPASGPADTPAVPASHGQ